MNEDIVLSPSLDEHCPDGFFVLRSTSGCRRFILHSTHQMNQVTGPRASQNRVSIDNELTMLEALTRSPKEVSGSPVIKALMKSVTGRLQSFVHDGGGADETFRSWAGTDAQKAGTHLQSSVILYSQVEKNTWGIVIEK